MRHLVKLILLVLDSTVSGAVTLAVFFYQNVKFYCTFCILFLSISIFVLF